MPPSFSVVIPCFDQGAFIEECLESLRAQTLPALEILVVDDGSTDPWTVRRLDEVCRPPVRLIRKKNGGPSSARNAGAREAKGDWVITLDGDDMLSPNALAAYAEAIVRAPEVDIWFPDIQHFGLEHHPWICPEFNPWRQLWENLMTSSAAIRRAVFESGTRFDESMPGYEDWAFYVEACVERRFVARNLPKPLFRYRKWGYSLISKSDERKAELLSRLREGRQIYRDDRRLLEIKRSHAPYFVIAAQSELLAPALEGQTFADFLMVDSTDRAAREGNLESFRDGPGNLLLVSLADAALARTLKADSFLLEKIVRLREAHDWPCAWLVGDDGGSAYPGFLTHPPFARSQRAIALVVSHRHLLAGSGLSAGTGNFAARLATHLAASSREPVAEILAGEVSPDEGIARPSAPEWARLRPRVRAAARRRTEIFRRAASELSQSGFESSILRRLKRWNGRPDPSAPGGIRSPAERHEEAVAYLTHVPPFFGGVSAPRAGECLAWMIAAPWIVHGGVDRGLVDLVLGARRTDPTRRIYLLLTERERMIWGTELLANVDGVFSMDHLSEAASPGRALASLVGRLGVEALLVANSFRALEMLPELRRLRPDLRVVIQVHSFASDADTGAPVGPAADAASRYNNLISSYAAISRAAADRLSGALYVSPGKTHIVRLGIDTERFARVRRARFQDDPLKVLWVGRFADEKDPLLALEVVRLWRDRHGAEGLRLTMVGSGPLVPAALELRKRRRLEPMIDLVGAVDDPLPFYREADCLLMTSTREGIPVVIYEAMAAGLLPIAPLPDTAIGEVLDASAAHLIADARNPEPYLDALERIRAHPDQARARTERVMALAADLSRDRYARQTLELLFPSHVGEPALAVTS